MKHMKRLIVLTVAALLLATSGGAIMAATTVYIDSYTDNKGNQKSQTKTWATTFSEGSFSVEVNGGTDNVSKVKVNKSGMTAKITYNYVYKGNEYNDPYRSVNISYYPTKTGTYKISFKVGKKSYSYTVKVYNRASLTNKVKFGSQTLRSYKLTVKGNTRTYESTTVSRATKKSGKLKITANGPYAIKGKLIVVTFDKKGNVSFKTVKNGGKITLSKGYEKQKNENSSFTAGKKWTYIYIPHKDKVTGATYTYSVAKNPYTKKKAVKRVYKYAGRTDTMYFNNGDGAEFAIWQY